LFHEHLDWHGDAEHYVGSKLRLFDLVADGVVLINGQDAVLTAATAGQRNRVIANQPPCLHRLEDTIYAGEGGDVQPVFDATQWGLPGRHNLDNAALVLVAGRRLGHDLSALTAALARFKPLRHRLETVAQTPTQRWINDSIATSPHATHAALSAVSDQPVVLMVGGQRRPSDWQVVIDGLKDRLTHQPLAGVVALPDSGAEVAERLVAAGVIKRDAVRSVSTMSAAVQAAAELAPVNSVVLLSPGAPSFSQYRDFEDRGDQFTAAAKAYCERLTE
jgi:UDP-N-acetylmuramoylalanine--D-glutamate ligase